MPKTNLEITFYDPANLNYPGGGELTLLTMAERLAQRGHSINLIHTKCSLHKSYSPTLTSLTYRFHNITSFELKYLKFLRGFPVPSPLEINKLVKLFNSANIAYLYVYLPNEALASILRSCIRTPFVGGFHMSFPVPSTIFEDVYQPIFKRSLRSFDGFRTLNTCSTLSLQNLGYMNTYFIPNGVDVQKFNLCENPSDGYTFNVLFVGDLIKQKGVDLLLDIINFFINRVGSSQNIKFIIVGAGPFTPQFKSISEKYSFVDYYESVPHSEMSKIYKKANLFLFPSLSEGMSRVVLEAQSCGLPVVGSDISGINEIVKNNITGILLKNGTVHEYLDSILFYQKLWRTSPADYYELNKRIRAYVYNTFDWEVIMDKLEIMFMSFL